MTLPKANPGDRVMLSGRAYNEIADAVNRRPAPDGRAAKGSARPSVLICNSSGSDVPRGGVLGIEGPLIKPDDNEAEFASRVVLNGWKPDIAKNRGRFAVLIEPLADGNIGRCITGGIVQAKIAITTGLEQWADIKDAESGYLLGGASGSARILWLDGVSETVWGLVDIGTQGEQVVAKITGILSLDDAVVTYSAIQQQISASTGKWENKPGGLLFDSSASGVGGIVEINHMENVQLYTNVIVTRWSGGYTFDSQVGLGMLFPVALTQTGGSAGDKTTQCSFTYTVEDIASPARTLGTVITPAHQRPSLGAIAAASKGSAYYTKDLAGDLQLVLHWTDEVFSVEACP